MPARGFTEGEWLLPRTIADSLEWSYGWSGPAAQRLRFLLDFGYATRLRAREVVGAVLRDIHLDERGEPWHASIATTSMYLGGDDVKRARQITEAFGSRNTTRRPG